MIIREMKRSDIIAIAELEKICFSDPWSENSIASELHNRLSCWLVATEGDRLLGYVGSQSVLDAADVQLIIPMNPHCESLNAAIAAAIVMWQMKVS